MLCLESRTLDLPPLYRPILLRDVIDPFAHACATAGERRAGTLVWTPRSDAAEFAVVLEPEEPLATAARAIYVGMNALAAALAAHAPPELPIAFDWPDAIRVDGVLVGGARLGWPAEVREHEAPAWLVLSAIIRTTVVRGSEPGLRPLHGALDELGFGSIEPAALIASFARHLMAGFHDWSEKGFAPVARRFMDGLANEPGHCLELTEAGDLLVRSIDGTRAAHKSLRDALAAPPWRDPATGMPWL